MGHPDRGFVTPPAYFLTWSCHGARMHGDVRESVDRRWTTPGTPRLAVNPARQRYEQRQLRTSPVALDVHARENVRDAIEGVARFRDWQLFALNVRTNHVHVVISAPIQPERVMTTLKAWATRRLRAEHPALPERVWTRHGSTRYLWDEAALEAACDYVINRQDGEADE